MAQWCQVGSSSPRPVEPAMKSEELQAKGITRYSHIERNDSARVNPPRRVTLLEGRVDLLRRVGFLQNFPMSRRVSSTLGRVNASNSQPRVS